MLGISHLGIQRVLEDNANTRKNLATLFLGLLFGIFGSAFSTVVTKYLYLAVALVTTCVWVGDAIIGVGFCIFSVWFFRELQKILAEHLAEEDVLGHLVEMVESDQKIADTLTSSPK